MSWIQNNEDDGDDIINNDALRQLRRSPLQTNLNIDFDPDKYYIEFWWRNDLNLNNFHIILYNAVPLFEQLN